MDLEQISALIEKADILKKKRIKELCAEFGCPLTAIPGLSAILGATILCEIGDISRSSSAEKLLAYASMDPSVKQSGDFKGNFWLYV